MIATDAGLHPSRLRAVARRARSGNRSAGVNDERCELCGLAIAAEHRHVLDARSGVLHCACRACAVLFDRVEAGGGHYRALPLAVRRLADFDLDDVAWAALDVPVSLAFFVTDGSGTVTARYPNPLGTMQSTPDVAVWRQLCRANPVLSSMEPEIEALLVYRRPPVPQHWLVPVDVCYRLVALLRRHWVGFTGGAVWDEIAAFFEGLEPRSRTRA